MYSPIVKFFSKVLSLLLNIFYFYICNIDCVFLKPIQYCWLFCSLAKCDLFWILTYLNVDGARPNIIIVFCTFLIHHHRFVVRIIYGY
ncbi:MAG: WzyE family oligosaccharide polymerase [Arsenophonus sp. NC-TX2-MAG3]